jgi:hypothetical protein
VIAQRGGPQAQSRSGLHRGTLTSFKPST